MVVLILVLLEVFYVVVDLPCVFSRCEEQESIEEVLALEIVLFDCLVGTDPLGCFLDR